MRGPTNWEGVAHDYAIMLANRGVLPTQLAVITHNHTPVMPCVRCGRTVCDGPSFCLHTVKPLDEVPQ